MFGSLRIRVAPLTFALSALVVACGAAPSESVGASGSELTADPNYCKNLPAPFTKSVLEKVYNPPDEGFPRGSYSYETDCAPLTSAPLPPPPGGYGPNTISSCSQGKAVPPPSATSMFPQFSACTAGYYFPNPTNAAEWTSVFLCPTSAITSGSYPKDPYVYTWGPIDLPINGCFGPALDPVNWHYVAINFSLATDPSNPCGVMCPAPVY
jgi:hypothetical protein